MNNKTTSSYIELLDNIKSYIFDNRENKSSVNLWEPQTIHCDLEFSIILAIKQVFPNIQIRLCLWHFNRNLELKSKNIYGDINNHTNESLNMIKRIKSLSFIDPEYVKAFFKIIKLDANNSNEQNKKFVIEYFEKTYIEKYNIIYWNYFKNMAIKRIMLAKEYHHLLNSKFNSKSTIWKFINIIRIDDNIFRIDLNDIRNGNFKKRKGG